MVRSAKADSAAMPPRERIKHAAVRLFADKGIDQVGVREIAAAAGFKNCGSLRHYFGTKDMLIWEISVEGMNKVNRYRYRVLQQLEEENGGVSIRDALSVIIALPTEAIVGYQFMRFFRNIKIERPMLVKQILAGDAGDALRLCTTHIMHALDHLPPEVAMDRIELCYEYLFIYNATIAAKPSSNDRVPHWRSDQFRENMFDTAEAMLTAPMSAPTVAAYASARTVAPSILLPQAG